MRIQDWKKDVAVKVVMLGGETGKSAYAAAVEAGYTGTEAEFALEQANFARNAQTVSNMAENIKDMFSVTKISGDDYKLSITTT